MAEIVAYDRALSDGVRQKIEGYLAHKWGLDNKLSSAHSYKVAKPAFGGAQVLTFQPIPDKQVGQTVTLDVSSDSGLSTFSFDSNDSSVVSFSGNVATALQSWEGHNYRDTGWAKHHGTRPVPVSHLL